MRKSHLTNAPSNLKIPLQSAVVTPKLTSGLPKQVAEAAIMHGLPTTSLTAFVTAIATGAAESAAAIVGVTPAILTAAEAAVKQAYADAYRFVVSCNLRLT